MELKAETALGTKKKVIGEIEALRTSDELLPSFRILKKSLKGKILVCLGKVSKGIIEKARALDVVGIVCQEVEEEELIRIKKELKSSFSPTLFAFLVVNEKIELDKIEGKMATIDVEKKRLIVEI